MKKLTEQEDAIMHKALMRSVKVVAPGRCRTEQDCGWQPWCRIEGRCKRAEPQREGGES